MNNYVTIDGYKYAVLSGTYIRKWMRSFTSELVANLIRLNYVDRGPGVRVWGMTLILATWSHDSLLYKAGITQTVQQQMANLEASYKKIATSIQFLDPFGNPPAPPNYGTYFTNYNQIIPNYSTNNKVYILAEIELTESTTKTI